MLASSTVFEKCSPMSSSGCQPVIRSIDSDMNVKRPSASVEKTTSGRVLDEEAVALLRLAQLALEAFLPW